MATITCTTTTVGGAQQTRYTCRGLFCARAIRILKEQDNLNETVPVGEFKILQVPSDPDDTVMIGLRSFPVNEYDIIVAELEDGVVEVTVLKGDKIIFKRKRPKKTIHYSKQKSYSVPIFEAFEEEEDYVKVDVKDLENRYFKV